MTDEPDLVQSRDSLPRRQWKKVSGALQNLVHLRRRSKKTGSLKSQVSSFLSEDIVRALRDRAGDRRWVRCTPCAPGQTLEVRQIPDTLTYLDSPFGDTWKYEARYKAFNDKKISLFPVAVKALRPLRLDKETDNPATMDRLKKLLLREVEKSAKLRHLNVAPLLGYHEGATIFDQYIVTPWYPNGSLVFWCRNEPDLDEKHAMIAGISAGLNYLYKMEVLHGDLRPDNILVDDSANPILIDFGYSTIADDGTIVDPSELRPIASDASNVKWVPPERLELAKPSLADDVYVFGCLTLYILTGKAPYHTATSQAAFWTNRRTEPPSSPILLPDSPLKADSPWWTIMNRCWLPANSSPEIQGSGNYRPSMDNIDKMVQAAIKSNLDCGAGFTPPPERTEPPLELPKIDLSSQPPSPGYQPPETPDTGFLCHHPPRERGSPLPPDRSPYQRSSSCPSCTTSARSSGEEYRTIYNSSHTSINDDETQVVNTSPPCGKRHLVLDTAPIKLV